LVLEEDMAGGFAEGDETKRREVKRNAIRRWNGTDGIRSNDREGAWFLRWIW